MKSLKLTIILMVLVVVALGCGQEQQEQKPIGYGPLVSAIEQIQGTDKYVILDFYSDL